MIYCCSTKIQSGVTFEKFSQIATDIAYHAINYQRTSELESSRLHNDLHATALEPTINQTSGGGRCRLVYLQRILIKWRLWASSIGQLAAVIKGGP